MADKTINAQDGIAMLSGAMFDYNNPAEADVTIDDIATALSNVCRFAGHVPQFYSVAQHAVNVSLLVPEEDAFSALMHDTAEAFTNDLPSPLKWAFPVFKELETKIETAMADRFSFTYPLTDAVKQADLVMLRVEKELIKRDTRHWGMLDGVEMPDVSKLFLRPMTPFLAKELFMARYRALTGTAAPEAGTLEQMLAAREADGSPSYFMWGVYDEASERTFIPAGNA